MTRKALIVASSFVALALALSGCSGQGDGSAEPGASEPGTSTNEQTETTTTTESEFAVEFAKAAEHIDLGIDIEALGKIEWRGVEVYDASETADGSVLLDLVGSQEHTDALIEWIDAQNWDGWYVPELADPDGAFVTSRWLDESSVTGQAVEGTDTLQLNIVYYSSSGD